MTATETLHEPGGKVRLAMLRGMRGGAEWAGARKEFRPLLWREWGEAGAPFALFVGMNPSTADAEADDPTIRREVGFCMRWGLTAYRKCNVSDYRATNPNALRQVERLESEANLPTILMQAREAHVLVLAFGALPPILRPLGQRLVGRLEDLAVRMMCLGTSRDGSPRHPLYLRADTPLVEWEGWR